MLEIALCAVAAVLALGGAGLAALRARTVPRAATAPARSVKLLRDDAVIGAVASAIALVTMLLGRRSFPAAAWSAGACAAGALAAIAARAWRERFAGSRAAGAVGEQVVIVSALVVLTATAAASSHTLSDPQRLASRLPQLVVAFVLGCAALDIGVQAPDAPTVGGRALPSAAVMVLASYFFDSNAGSLRSAASYASALGFVLFPLAAAALGALGAAVATLVHRRGAGSAIEDVANMPPRTPEQSEGTRLLLGSVLAVPAAAGAALALLGWLWEPIALCAAIGAVMTLVPKLVRTEGRLRETASLIALGVAVVGSFAVARHAGLAHAGPLGVGVAAVAAEGASLLDRGDENDEKAALADRQAAALAAIAVALAVLDGAVLAKCMHFAEDARAPTSDTAVMLAQCTTARVAPARIDLSHPVTMVAALAGLAACVLARSAASLRARVFLTVSIVSGVALAAAAAHFAFALGVESLAAAVLASSLAAALFPSSCSRPIAALIAAAGLALAAAVA